MQRDDNHDVKTNMYGSPEFYDIGPTDRLTQCVNMQIRQA